MILGGMKVQFVLLHARSLGVRSADEPILSGGPQIWTYASGRSNFTR